MMTDLVNSADSSSNVSATDTTANRPGPLADRTTRQRRLFESSSVIDTDNEKNNATGESFTKDLTWSMLEHEDIFLANEVSDKESAEYRLYTIFQVHHIIIYANMFTYLHSGS